MQIPIPLEPLQGIILGKYLVWIGDLCDDPQYCEEPWWISSQGGPLSYGNAAGVGHVRVVVIPVSGRNNDGDGYI